MSVKKSMPSKSACQQMLVTFSEILKSNTNLDKSGFCPPIQFGLSTCMLRSQKCNCSMKA